MDLTLHVPPSLWEIHEPATVYLLRRQPGLLEQIDTAEAEAFLAGRGALPLPGGAVDLAAITFSIESDDEDLRVRPCAMLYRRPVTGIGRLDTARLEQVRQRRAEERSLSMGWSATPEETAIMSDAISRLVEEATSFDPRWSVTLLDPGS